MAPQAVASMPGKDSSSEVTFDERNIPGVGLALERRITDLSRTFTRNSVASLPRDHANPFFSGDPTLDPASPLFDPKHWASALLNEFSKDPEKFPRHTVGLSYRDVGVYGYGSSTDYQKNVLNVMWRGPQIVKEWVSSRRQRVQILKDFDGLVKRGEMLLVLGRPGRYVGPLCFIVTACNYHINRADLANIQWCVDTSKDHRWPNSWTPSRRKVSLQLSR